MSFAARSLADALPYPAAIADDSGRVLVANERWRDAGTGPGCPAHGRLAELVRDGLETALTCDCDPAGPAALRISHLESTCGAQRRLITVERLPGVFAGEVRTPAAVVAAAIDLLRAQALPGAPAESLDEIRLTVEGLEALAGDLAERAAPPTPAVESPRATLPALPPGRVLLAEDDQVNRTMLQRMISVLGVECDTVPDGAAAVTALLGETKYDLALLDMQMPAMGGPEATRAARAAGCRVPILALTATTLAEDQERCRDAGMDGHLPKPITLPELRHALEPYLTAAPEAPPEVAALSRAQLHELELQLEGRELVEMTVNMFLAELDGRRQAMDAALDSGSNDRLAAVAHTLKSSSALLGAQPLADACARVERLAGSPVDAEVLAAAVSEVGLAAGAAAIAMAEYLNET